MLPQYAMGDPAVASPTETAGAAHAQLSRLFAQLGGRVETLARAATGH